MQFGWKRLALLVAFVLILGTVRPVFSAAQMNAGVWGSKPVLAQLLLDGHGKQALTQALGFSWQEAEAVVEIARQEAEQIEQLDAESRLILANPMVGAAEKRATFAAGSYNGKIWSTLEKNQSKLQQVLGDSDYRRLVDWVDVQWAAEQAALRSVGGNSETAPVLLFESLSLPRSMATSAARSFDVYATCYDAGEREIVALPDKCLKFANGGAMQCAGYAFGQGYSIMIGYQGKLVAALVAESGPWNVDDNYWSKLSDSQPRRMFADLGLGVPEAQAAYFNGYNGGLDQYGRVVTSPVGLDVSCSLAKTLGLPSGNTRVAVTYLWTEGWDQTVPGTSSTPGTASGSGAIGWTKATPNPDGSMVHTVQAGQTLVGIATVYEIPLQELLDLNGLTMQSVIRPGDNIVVKAAEPTLTSSATLTEAPTRTPKPMRTATLQPTMTEERTVAVTATEPSLEDAKETGGVDWMLVGICAVGLIGVGLLTWGLAVGRKRSR